MENSFFEYRDETGVESDSDYEVIDDSLMEPKAVLKQGTNRTAFVPESDESSSEDDPQQDQPKHKNSQHSLRKSFINTHIISSSDDDGNQIIKATSHSEAVVSSSEEDDEEYSPEMLPRRPQSIKKPTDQTNRVQGLKNKRMMFDSDLDNSITVEHNRHRKQMCLKDTPIKVEDIKRKSLLDDSMRDASGYVSNDNSDGDSAEKDDSSDETKYDSDGDEPGSHLDTEGHKNNSENKQSNDETVSHDKTLESDSQTPSKNDSIRFTARKLKDCRRIVSDESSSETDDEQKQEVDDPKNGSHGNSIDDKSNLDLDDNEKWSSKTSACESDLDGPDEYEMAVRRATRKSIMGFIPNENNDSDESDCIQSDESHRISGHSDVMQEENQNYKEGTRSVKTPERDGDNSRLSCSPIKTPLHDVTNVVIESVENSPSAPKGLTNKVQSELATEETGNKENYIKYDDDVTIVDTKPEVIQLSSDDEDEVKIEHKTSNVKKSPKIKNEADKSPKKSRDNTIKSYLVPPSYPNQGVVYVKKSIRENELFKLNSLKEDLHNVKRLLQQVEVNTLPDGGVKLIERLTGLEAEIRRQGDKVANMVVEPENPTIEEIAKDGFEKGLSWEEIQKASIAVQPRMFGKQAMASHMAERNLILDRLRDLHESLASCPPESQLAAPPRGLRSQLMPHQLHALAWLHWRETQRPAAGILADDMGLGKTITMIALMVSDKENSAEDDDSDDERPGDSRLVRGGTLVVCPASLVQQWAGEVEKHCAGGRLAVALHHGPARARHAHRLAAADLVLTTYNILQRDHDKGVLFRVRWRRVVLDEAHAVRNHKSATCRAAAALPAARRWALSGTPVHNKDLDLFALLQFLRCSPFDDLSMWKKWIDNKSLGGQERLSTIMRCLLLRRTKLQLQQKGQLACLPQRHTHEQQVTLSKNEMNVYQKVLVFSKTLFAQFLHQRAEKNSEQFGAPLPDKDSEYAKMHKRMIALQGAKPVKSHEILVLLLRLRQVCCHCGLIAAMLDDAAPDLDADPAGSDLLDELNKMSLEDSRKESSKDDEDETEGVQEEGTTAAEAIRSVLSPNNPVFELTRPSSKINAVMECLKENVFSKPGEKAVIVSQWTSVLHLVEKQLSAMAVRSVTLSGSVPVTARPALVHAINDHNSAVKVMLLSLCAGGVGLNLCGANHLFLLDPHWNPQLEQQAQDRVYRVGQDKTVHIYRFMCVDTVEQSIRKLQEAKLELADNVLTGAKNTNASKLTIEDLKMLFNMGQQQ